MTNPCLVSLVSQQSKTLVCPSREHKPIKWWMTLHYFTHLFHFSFSWTRLLMLIPFSYRRVSLSCEIPWLNKDLSLCFGFGVTLWHTTDCCVCCPLCIACQHTHTHNGHWPCDVSTLPGVFGCIQLNHAGPKRSIAAHRGKGLDCLSVVVHKSHFITTSWNGWMHSSLKLLSDVVPRSSSI